MRFSCRDLAVGNSSSAGLRLMAVSRRAHGLSRSLAVPNHKIYTSTGPRECQVTDKNTKEVDL